MAVFITLLAGIAITDAKHYLIPDGFTVFGLGWVLATTFIALFLREPSVFAGLYDALIGACAGAGAIAIAGWLGEVALGREAMGFGDVTLMAVVGAAVGPNRALLTIFVAAALGVVIFLGIIYPIARVKASQRHEATQLPLVPFGVFLAPAACLSLVFGNMVIQWYLHRVLAF
jgi:leader peptidase (prepilin peptidase)/N-methyltransferase